MITLFICIIVFIHLLSDSYEYDDIKSKIRDSYNSTIYYIFLILCSTILLPYTLYKIITINLKLKKMQKRSIITTIIVLVLAYTSLSIYNKSTDLFNQNQRLINSFNKEFSQRTAIYENIAYSISANIDITLKVDSSFQKVVNMQVINQKDGENLAWKWISQINPSATYSEIANMYKELMSSINQNRQKLLDQESVLLSIKNQQLDLLTLFPNNVYFSFLDEKRIEFEPISSNYTNKVIKTGKETIPINILNKQ